ncbi:hypothetical protein SUNI508_05624 [Seiridium unicorne]|uniref:Uncharacterized protein n=1 Tax=Seiridium unicorne TaxID=138068 RepID=A0ABR2V554_9PEZI
MNSTTSTMISIPKGLEGALGNASTRFPVPLQTTNTELFSKTVTFTTRPTTTTTHIVTVMGTPTRYSSERIATTTTTEEIVDVVTVVQTVTVTEDRMPSISLGSSSSSLTKSATSQTTGSSASSTLTSTPLDPGMTGTGDQASVSSTITAATTLGSTPGVPPPGAIPVAPTTSETSISSSRSAPVSSSAQVGPSNTAKPASSSLQTQTTTTTSVLPPSTFSGASAADISPVQGSGTSQLPATSASRSTSSQSLLTTLEVIPIHYSVLKGPNTPHIPVHTRSSESTMPNIVSYLPTTLETSTRRD